MDRTNVKYFKDLNHNYLIIKSEMKEERNYQHNMLTANKMKHLLGCKIKYVDGESHFYYEISSRQNMVCLFDRKTMGYEQIFHFFESIKEALAELDGYLLDSRCLILEPEYIYGNPGTEEYFFLYYPYYMEKMKEGAYMPLAEFLVEKVEHGQEETVSIVYKIYEMAQDNEFMIAGILQLFAEAAAEVREREEIEDIGKEPETEAPEYVEAAMRQEETDAEDEGMPKHLMAAGILAFVCTLMAAGIFGIRYFYTLSMEETILSMAGSIVLTVLSAFLFLYLIFNICGGKGRRNQEKKHDAIPLLLNDKETVQPLKEMEMKEMEMREIEYGNTVFLETAMCKTEHKLYGTNKGNKYHIDLGRLPCTIGKMAGSVDVVIKDSTMSRIHARFTRQGADICVTDMNSTNGTFKNGLRLEPNETVPIEQGDELRFGRMTFCYR